MRTRILIAVSAWLLGAMTATGLSLLAVSQLGRGLVDETSQQQLTLSAVNSALASEKAEQPATPSPRPTRTHHPAPATRAAHAVRRPAQRHQASSSPSPTPSPTPSPPPGTLLTSSAGTVVAACQAAGAYLLSWSPQQGFEAQNVVRGPAAVASVLFDSSSRTLTMRVTCRGGVPTVQQSGDDGGGGDD